MPNVFLYVRKLVISVCWKLIQLSSEKPTFNSSKLPDLCPTDNAENCEVYIDRLKELLVNREVVKEIAITAPYSGGKSSFINTYKRLNPYHKYTCISLGAFADGSSEKQPEDGKAEGASTLNKVEKSILQQILYKTDSCNTPNSRFRRIIKSHPNYLTAINSSVIFAVLGICIAIISYIPEYSLKHIFSEFVKNGVISTFSLALIIYAISVFILLLKYLFKIIPKFNLSKFNPIKGEVAFEQKSNDSVFNIYLEEIIYYFSKTKSDVVFFEDLDRFERTEIFVQLKELNKLINDSADVKQSVRFIYALKDDVFKGANRTKFFDAIIPIIPITNKSNSFPLLKRLMNDSGFENDLEDNYLRDIAVFVDDMRLLKNIVAEYGVYKPILKKNLPKIKLQKLFSFIIYKNIYCDDFSELHSGNGKLATFFNSLKNLKSDFKDAVKENIHLLEKSLIDSEYEHLRSIKELNTLYLSLAITNINQLETIGGYSIANVLEPDNFEKLLLANRVDTKRPNNHWPSAIMFSDLVNAIEPSYEFRKNNIANKSNVYRSNTKSGIETLKQKLSSITHLSIKELIQQYDRLSVFKDISEEKLLIHLIDKGYIDEQYHLYISVFHEGYIAKSDIDFVMAVKSHEFSEPNKSLINCDEILKYFSDEEFRSPSFFNYNMLDHLLEKGERSILINVIESVLKQQENNIEVIYEANHELVNFTEFGTLLIDNWLDIWLSILSYKNLTTEKRNELLIELLSCVNNNDLMEDYIEVLKYYIDQNEGIASHLPTDDKSKNHIQKLFVYLDVKFQQLNNCADNSNFLEFIIKEELFVINPTNLLIAINALSEKMFSNKFTLSDIYELKNEGLTLLINHNIVAISHFIDSGEIGVGSKAIYLNFLNNSAIDNGIKKALVVKEIFSIDELSEIDEETELWGCFFQNNKVKASWDNVTTFMQSQSFDESALVSFLNLGPVYSELFDQEVSLSEEHENKLVDLLISENITLSAFEKLQMIVAHLFEGISLENVSNDKLNSLIVNGHINANISNYRQLKNIDYKLSCLLLENDFDKFLLGIDYESSGFESAEIDFDFDELRILLNSSALTVKHKNIIVKEAQKKLINAPVDILNVIIAILNETPFPIPKISADLLESLLQQDASQESRVLAYLNQIRHLSNDNKIKYLGLLGSEYHKITVTKSNTTIPDTPYNFRLARGLKDVGLISTFSQTLSLSGNKELKINAKRKHQKKAREMVASL